MPTPSDGVAEWVERKGRRCADPLDAIKAGCHPCTQPEASDGTDWVVARAGGVVVARTCRVQEANRRYYFPIEDCIAEHLESSPKRWT